MTETVTVSAERLHRLAVQVEELRELAWKILDRLVDESRERVEREPK